MEEPVKNSTLTLIALMLAACACPIPRAGPVVGNRFASERDKKNNQAAGAGEVGGGA